MRDGGFSLYWFPGRAILSAPGITLASSEFRSGLWNSARINYGIYPSFYDLLHNIVSSGEFLIAQMDSIISVFGVYY